MTQILSEVFLLYISAERNPWTTSTVSGQTLFIAEKILSLTYNIYFGVKNENYLDVTRVFRILDIFLDWKNSYRITNVNYKDYV